MRLAHAEHVADLLLVLVRAGREHLDHLPRPGEADDDRHVLGIDEVAVIVLMRLTFTISPHSPERGVGRTIEDAMNAPEAPTEAPRPHSARMDGHESAPN